MASNWGDFNGDGKTNYVDYKIYSTQIDPYSGEYQRNRPRSGGGSGLGAYYLILFIIICVYCFFLK